MHCQQFRPKNGHFFTDRIRSSKWLGYLGKLVSKTNGHTKITENLFLIFISITYVIKV